jgi:hypothetical protein
MHEVKIKLETSVDERAILFKIWFIYNFSGRELRKNWDIPSELMRVLVVLTSKDIFGDNLDYYGVFHVSDMINQYIRLEPNKKKDWLKQQRVRAESIEWDTREREAEDERRLKETREENKLEPRRTRSMTQR